MVAKAVENNNKINSLQEPKRPNAQLPDDLVGQQLDKHRLTFFRQA